MNDSTAPVVLITGATSGIGRATALALAKQGAHLLLLARNSEKAQALSAELAAETGKQSCEVFLADLSVQAEIRRVAHEIQDKYDRIDVLINNAGQMLLDRHTTADGYEYTFALNHLAYFHLTLLLLDQVKAAPAGRIVNVSSQAHWFSRLNFSDLMNAHRFNGFKVYAQSKLANLYMTYELSRRLESSPIMVNALHPGGVRSNFYDNLNKGLWKFLSFLASPFLISPEKGAETIIFLASSPEVAGQSGKYFIRRKAKRSSPASYDEQAARRLWDRSKELINQTAIPTASESQL